MSGSRSRRAGIAGLIGVLAVALGPEAAVARSDAESHGPTLTIEADQATTVRAAGHDVICEQARSRSGVSGPCRSEHVGSASRTRLATRAMVQRFGELRAADGTRLAVAARSCPIYYRDWSQTQRGLYYVNWWEKHKGRYFFNQCGRVWSTTYTLGYKGYHRCDLGGSFGYSISIKSCFTERRYDLANNPISEWDFYKVHVAWNGFPMSVSQDMHVNAYPSGALYFHG